MELVSKNHYLSWTFAGVLLGAGFVFPYLWGVSLIGGLFFLWLSKESRSFQEMILGSWLAWSVKSLLAVSWFWSVYPIEWLPLSPGIGQLSLVFLYWLTAGILLGSGGALVALVLGVISKPNRNNLNKFSLLIFPLAWVLGEIGGSIIFSIFTLGPGGSINSSFSFGYIGYLFTESELLLMFAKVAGVYGLSFIFAVFSVFAYKAVTRGSYLRYIFLGVALTAYSLSFFGGIEEVLPTDGKRVIIVETWFPSRLSLSLEGLRDNRQSLEAAVISALAENPDHIILPEDARFFDQSRPSITKQLFAIRYDNPTAALLDTGRFETEEGAILQALFYNGPEQRVEKLHKRYLVPQGEYIPTLYRGLLKTLSSDSEIGAKLNEISYKVGPLTDQSEVAENLPGVLFCFESADPLGVRRILLERNEVPYIAHPVSHSWFHEPHILWHQFNSMLQVQAVWNGVYIVSAANQATSHVYTPSGDILTAQEIKSGDHWRLREVFIPLVY